jgi:hypothetical protein
VAIWWRFEWRGVASMVRRLTKQSLAGLKPRSKAYVEYDADLIGFGIAVYSSVSVRRQFDSVESVVIHLALPDSMEAPDVDERKSGAV